MYYSWDVKQTHHSPHIVLVFSDCLGSVFVSNGRFVNLSVVRRIHLVML
jgi:hypothetical protein